LRSWVWVFGPASRIMGLRHKFSHLAAWSTHSSLLADEPLIIWHRKDFHDAMFQVTIAPSVRAAVRKVHATSAGSSRPWRLRTAGAADRWVAAFAPAASVLRNTRFKQPLRSGYGLLINLLLLKFAARLASACCPVIDTVVECPLPRKRFRPYYVWRYRVGVPWRKLDAFLISRYQSETINYHSLNTSDCVGDKVTGAMGYQASTLELHVQILKI